MYMDGCVRVVLWHIISKTELSQPHSDQNLIRTPRKRDSMQYTCEEANGNMLHDG